MINEPCLIVKSPCWSASKPPFVRSFWCFWPPLQRFWTPLQSDASGLVPWKWERCGWWIHPQGFHHFFVSFPDENGHCWWIHRVFYCWANRLSPRRSWEMAPVGLASLPTTASPDSVAMRITRPCGRSSCLTVEWKNSRWGLDLVLATRITWIIWYGFIVNDWIRGHDKATSWEKFAFCGIMA